MLQGLKRERKSTRANDQDAHRSAASFRKPTEESYLKVILFLTEQKGILPLLRFIYCLLSHLQIATYGAYRSENIAPHIKSYAFWRTPSQMRPYLLPDAFVSGSRRVRDCSQMRLCLLPRSLTTRVRDNILKSKEQKNIQPTKGGHKMVTCQNYVSLFYRQITSCPSDGGIS